MKNIFLLLLSVLLLSSCFRLKSSNGGGEVENVKARTPQPEDIVVPEGYQIELVAEGLTFPTAITFDDDGTPYVLEAGYSYGEEWTEPKLLRIEDDGKRTVVATGGVNGPWNGIDYHNGQFYIAEGGVLKGGKIIRVNKNGEKEVLVEDLPSLGDHHTNGPVIHNGYLYFSQGTATNSGVVGVDNYKIGWLDRFSTFNDIPCEDIVVNGYNFKSENPLTDDPDDKVETGAYVPFGVTNEAGDTIPGQIPCSGAVFRMPLSGGEPELVAWGLRNAYGLQFSPDGKLYLTENGYDVRGNRPVFGAGDVLWEIKTGEWYGWPDYSAGKPIYKKDGFVPPGEDKNLKLLKEDPGTPPKPLAIFAVHSSSNGLDIISNPDFGTVGSVLVAQFGDMAPFVGKVWNPVGFKVVLVDPKTGVIQDFAANSSEENGPASWLESDGLERPIDVQFDPSGEALYVVDFGILMLSDEGDSNPIPETGVVWKISKKP
ncbi:PQQ-dependent sugar dehydrogenase [Nafulsella turpanensis]|uniref:PQQ-dependent sugar dehydrogenase n=1 Tax=Nafulsella turpanensis TaxID=1265690 RepID=UPI0003471BA7|nr:PQQ-dependent sugar dehydrogenase [Nafulsella turpanensis]